MQDIATSLLTEICDGIDYESKVILNDLLEIMVSDRDATLYAKGWMQAEADNGDES